MDVAAVRVSIFLEDGRPGELFLAIIFDLRAQPALICVLFIFRLRGG